MGVSRLEIVKLKPVGDWYEVQVAVDGTLCIPFEIMKAIRDDYPGEIEFLAYLQRQASALIEQFGDARCQDPRQFN